MNKAAAMIRYALFVFALGTQAACTTPAPSSEIRPAAAVCTTRAIVTVRQNAGIRNDSEFVGLMAGAGVNVEVLYNMTRNTRMVRVSALGPDAACRDAINQLRLDPRIESVNGA
jgi:hypothetical protein